MYSKEDVQRKQECQESFNLIALHRDNQAGANPPKRQAQKDPPTKKNASPQVGPANRRGKDSELGALHARSVFVTPKCKGTMWLNFGEYGVDPQEAMLFKKSSSFVLS